MKTLVAASLALTVVTVSNDVAALALTLDFSSLPSAQGWTFSTNGASESDVFSVSSGVLSQDTLGLGPSAGANYQIYGLLTTDADISLTFTARLLSEEGSPTDYGAVSAGIGFDGFSYAIALRPGEVRDLQNNLLSTAFDTSLFHEYELRIQPSVGYTVYVDNVLIASVAPSTESPLANYIYFGDGSALNALGEYSAFAVSQVPLPAPVALITCALAAIAARMRRGRRSFGGRELRSTEIRHPPM